MGLSNVMQKNPGHKVLITRVRNGFPVAFFYRIVPAEEEVGLPEGIEDGFVTNYKGESCDWLELSKSEIEELEDQAFISATGVNARKLKRYAQ